MAGPSLRRLPGPAPSRRASGPTPSRPYFRSRTPGIACSPWPIPVFTMLRSSCSRSTDLGVHDGPKHAQIAEGHLPEHIEVADVRAELPNRRFEARQHHRIVEGEAGPTLDAELAIEGVVNHRVVRLPSEPADEGAQSAVSAAW